MNSTQQEYYDWLCNEVSNEYHDFDWLLEILWEKEYYGIIDNDNNRRDDGLNLRYFYSDITNNSLTDLETLGPCRCLEMLVALAGRMDDELYGSEYNKTRAILFWELVENLGLTLPKNRDIVRIILHDWLERRYFANGDGGIFPLNKSRRNQLRVEIWYQMMEYINERYPI